MGRFASGVTVVTTLDEEGHPLGLTASSLSSVSLRPSLISVCVSRDAETHDPLIRSGIFAVNILSRGQEEVSRIFASSATREERWRDRAWEPATTGAPVLPGAAAFLDCRTWKTVSAGDHTIVIGQVVDSGAAELDPLLYHRGRYGGFSP